MALVNLLTASAFLPDFALPMGLLSTTYGTIGTRIIWACIPPQVYVLGLYQHVARNEEHEVLLRKTMYGRDAFY